MGQVMQLWCMPRQPAFTPDEQAAIEAVLPAYPVRDICLYRLLNATGLRISEGLSLTIHDVWNGTAIRPDLVIAKRRLKGGCRQRSPVKSRIIPVSDSLRPVLAALIFSIIGSGGDAANVNQPLFQGRGHLQLSRRQATHRLRQLLLAAGLSDRSGYGWHSARRTYASAIYAVTNFNLNLTRYVLGHAHLETTRIYLPEDDAAAREATLAIGRMPAPRAALNPLTAERQFF